jgi:hypothetical protein
MDEFEAFGVTFYRQKIAQFVINAVGRTQTSITRARSMRIAKSMQ